MIKILNSYIFAVSLVAVILPGCATKKMSQVEMERKSNESTQAFNEATPNGITRAEVVKDKIALHIFGQYPQDYYPAWRIASKDGINISFKNLKAYQNIPSSPTNQREISIQVKFDSLQDQAMVLIGKDTGLTCKAVIPGPPVLLSTKRTIFDNLVFQGMDSTSPCILTGIPAVKWAGAMSLEADPLGNLKTSFVLKGVDSNNKLVGDLLARDIDISNSMTPAQAANTKKSNEAFAAQRALELALVPADQTSVVASRKGKGFFVQTRNIDDLGGFFIIPKGGSPRLVASSEWTVKNQGGSSEAAIDDQLEVGENMLIFFIHNKQSSFSAGKWAFQASLNYSGGKVWTDQRTEAGGLVGIRYWKPIYMKKDTQGTIEVRSATNSEVNGVRTSMTAANANFVANYRTETSVMGEIGKGFLNELFNPTPKVYILER